MSVGGNKTGKFERDLRYPEELQTRHPHQALGNRGEKNASFNMNRRRMSVNIISNVTLIYCGVNREWRLFRVRPARRPPFTNENPSLYNHFSRRRDLFFQFFKPEIV